MGFFSKLKKVVKDVDKGATLAGDVLPGKAGDVAKDVGVVTSIVQQIQSSPAAGTTPAEAQKNATLVTAVAVDDHEQRLLQMEQTIQELQAALAAAKSQTAGGSTTGQATGTGTSTGTGQATTPQS
ncbi:MAG TPA: hypothetical protein VF708_12445 [Pyrinomonadaceae bacterium]|jgi:hypothetical protein